MFISASTRLGTVRFSLGMCPMDTAPCSISANLRTCIDVCTMRPHIAEGAHDSARKTSYLTEIPLMSSLFITTND